MNWKEKSFLRVLRAGGIYWQAEVICDECGYYYAELRGLVPAKTELVKSLREEGWKIGKRVICPDCVGVRQ